MADLQWTSTGLWGSGWTVFTMATNVDTYSDVSRQSGHREHVMWVTSCHVSLVGSTLFRWETQARMWKPWIPPYKKYYTIWYNQLQHKSGCIQKPKNLCFCGVFMAVTIIFLLVCPSHPSRSSKHSTRKLSWYTRLLKILTTWFLLIPKKRCEYMYKSLLVQVTNAVIAKIIVFVRACLVLPLSLCGSWRS